MQSEPRVLSFENERAETEEILDRTMLNFLHFLTLAHIDCLMVVDRDERFLDPMDTAIRHDDHAEKVRVDPEEEPQVHEHEHARKTDE